MITLLRVVKSVVKGEEPHILTDRPYVVLY